MILVSLVCWSVSWRLLLREKDRRYNAACNAGSCGWCTGARGSYTTQNLVVGAAEAFWRNFDLRDGGPKAAGRLL